MSAAIPSTLIRKLEASGFLSNGDRAVLEALTPNNRHVAAKRDLIREGDRPENVFVVLEGFACRYKLLRGGRRQIMAVLVPGDFCDLHIAILGAMDHSIATLTPCIIAEIPRKAIEELTDHHPRITRALWWATLVDEAILREWLVNMGQRPADRQMAHLFCELHMRLHTVGLASPDGCEMPLRQTDLADVLGITSVHVNRTLQELRAADLITLRSRKLEIMNVERLRTFCGFDPNYLHLITRTEHTKVENQGFGRSRSI